jgi:hypothetical protein
MFEIKFKACLLCWYWPVLIVIMIGNWQMKFALVFSGRFYWCILFCLSYVPSASCFVLILTFSKSRCSFCFLLIQLHSHILFAKSSTGHFLVWLHEISWISIFSRSSVLQPNQYDSGLECFSLIRKSFVLLLVTGASRVPWSRGRDHFNSFLPGLAIRFFLVNHLSILLNPCHHS